jgi:allantoicase
VRIPTVDTEVTDADSCLIQCVGSTRGSGKLLPLASLDALIVRAHPISSVQPAPSLKGQFGPNGALFSGWESRRHNESGVDW